MARREQDLRYANDFGVLSGLRNKLIDGDFDIWQRGTSIVPADNIVTYAADRWWFYRNGGGTLTVTRQTHTVGQSSVPGNPKYYLRAAQSVAGSGSTGNLIQQHIEGVGTLAGKAVTITFWAKADASRNFAVSLDQIFGTGGSPSGTVGTFMGTAALTTSWQKFTYTATLPSISGKTLGSNGDDYLGANFGFPTNATFTIDISHVSVVEGDATSESDPFSPRHVQQETALCQRYYWKMAGGFSALGRAYDAANGIDFNIPHPVVMRASPTITMSIDSSPTCTVALSALGANATRASINVKRPGSDATFGTVAFEASAEL
jgi:hypothetical protein